MSSQSPRRSRCLAKSIFKQLLRNPWAYDTERYQKISISKTALREIISDRRSSHIDFARWIPRVRGAFI